MMPKPESGGSGCFRKLAGMIVVGCLVGLLVYIGVQVNEGLVDIWWLDALG